MSTIAEIIADTRVRFPNSLTDANLLVFGNEILLKIWKWMDSPEIYTFSTVANQATYTLPVNGFDIDKIIDIEIATDTTNTDYISYPFQGLLVENPLPNYFYNVTTGIIGIEPIPTITGLDCRLIYGKKFTLMSTGDTTVIPAVNTDYHSIIVNYICMKAAICGNNPDTARHNDFAASYNDDWERMIFDYTRSKCKNPIKKRSNPQWG